MLDRKQQTVADLTQGIEFLMKKNKIDCHVGTAEIIKPGQVLLRSTKKGARKKTLNAPAILIATGSKVAPLCEDSARESKSVRCARHRRYHTIQ